MATGTTVERDDIDGLHGKIELRCYRPAAPSGRGLVWVHGGGFVSGSLDMPSCDWVASQLRDTAAVTVVTVGYRLASTEVHFPVPLDDVGAAWTWAVAEADRLGIDELHLGGASAGGNLATATALRNRDEGGPLPATLVLDCPTLHDVNPPLSPELYDLLDDEARQFTEWITPLYEMYVGHPLTEPAPPLVAPARADLRGLPPTLIVNCERDPVRASGEAFGELLVAAGVPVEVITEPGTTHGHINNPDDPAASRTVARMAAWLTSTRFDSGGPARLGQAEAVS
jgi:acetyl esterase